MPRALMVVCVCCLLKPVEARAFLDPFSLISVGKAAYEVMGGIEDATEVIAVASEVADLAQDLDPDTYSQELMEIEREVSELTSAIKNAKSETELLTVAGRDLAQARAALSKIRMAKKLTKALKRIGQTPFQSADKANHSMQMVHARQNQLILDELGTIREFERKRSLESTLRELKLLEGLKRIAAEERSR